MNLTFCGSDNAVVGVLNIRLVIRCATTLKEKRRVIKSLKDRIRNKFNVSIAEVGALDHCQYSKLGIAMVGNDRQFVSSAMSNLVNLFRCATPAELVEYHLEFI